MVILKIKENIRKIIDCDNFTAKKKPGRKVSNKENFDNCNREN